jgi:hypothetical protein
MALFMDTTVRGPFNLNSDLASCLTFAPGLVGRPLLYMHLTLRSLQLGYRPAASLLVHAYVLAFRNPYKNQLKSLCARNSLVIEVKTA